MTYLCDMDNFCLFVDREENPIDVRLIPIKQMADSLPLGCDSAAVGKCFQAEDLSLQTSKPAFRSVGAFCVDSSARRLGSTFGNIFQPLTQALFGIGQRSEIKQPLVCSRFLHNNLRLTVYR